MKMILNYSTASRVKFFGLLAVSFVRLRSKVNTNIIKKNRKKFLSDDKNILLVY